MGQLLSEFALRQPAIHVRVVYGASNELADHLLAGAPGDLFLSAEPRQLDRLDEAQRLVPRSRRLIASNGLAVIGPRGVTAFKKLSELRGKGVHRIALAETDCPLGGYSQVRLKSAGLYDAIQSKILYVDNSRAVLSAVAAGSADVGIAFTSDAERSELCRTWFQIPRSQAAAHYVAGLIHGGSQTAEAKILLEFIASPTAAKYFRRHGLQPIKA